MINAGLFQSGSCEWETPQDVFDELDQEFGFVVDVCAAPENAKCKHFYSRQDDGLAQDWPSPAWMNPPYGREIGKWLKKAWDEARRGKTVVCLIPSRTDTKWWHDYVMKADEIRFVRGRLRFGGHKCSAPFPSAVVVFRGATEWAS